MDTMDGGDPLKTMRDRVRRHHLRLAILALAAQGKPIDAEHLRRELPSHPAVAVIEYHLLVLRCAGLCRCRQSNNDARPAELS